MGISHSIATTRLSSKGQVVIPEDVRLEMGLKEGSQFVVIGRKDVVILKTINPPSIRDFDTLISDARQTARQAGFKKRHLLRAIKKVRRNS